MFSPDPDREWWSYLVTQPTIALPFDSLGVSGVQLYSGPGILCGWAFAEETAAAGMWVKAFDGEDAFSPLLAWIKLLSNDGDHEGPNEHGPWFRHGLFLGFTGAGQAGGVFWVKV